MTAATKQVLRRKRARKQAAQKEGKPPGPGRQQYPGPPSGDDVDAAMRNVQRALKAGRSSSNLAYAASPEARAVQAISRELCRLRNLEHWASELRKMHEAPTPPPPTFSIRAELVTDAMMQLVKAFQAGGGTMGGEVKFTFPEGVIAIMGFDGRQHS